MPIIRSHFRVVSALTTCSVLSLPYVSYAAYSQPTYYSQSTYTIQASYVTTFTDDVTVANDFVVSGSLQKGSGSFLIDHPLDPKNKLLYHSFVESPDAKNLYDGVVALDKNGEAVIRLPDYFMALNKDFRYQLKPIGESMPNLYVKSEIANNKFTIGGGKPERRISWQVTGTRHDAYILANPIAVEVQKKDDDLSRRGEYLHPDIYTESITQPLSRILNSIWGYVTGESP